VIRNHILYANGLTIEELEEYISTVIAQRDQMVDPVVARSYIVLPLPDSDPGEFNFLLIERPMGLSKGYPLDGSFYPGDKERKVNVIGD